jgi:hypothetical protein
MKILEPFAGYKLASGHPYLHLALFAASFTVDASLGKEALYSFNAEADGAGK